MFTFRVFPHSRAILGRLVLIDVYVIVLAGMRVLTRFVGLYGFNRGETGVKLGVALMENRGRESCAIYYYRGGEGKQQMRNRGREAQNKASCEAYGFK